MKRDCLVLHRGRWVWVTQHVACLCGWDRMHACDQKSDTWQQRRMHMLTASQVATAIDKNPYDTRDKLIQQYAGVCSKVFTGNEATRHGERYEDDAVAIFEKRTGKTVLTFGLVPFFDRKLLYMGGSVDGVTACGDLVEVKCPYRRKPNGDVPKHYVPQLQSLMCGLSLPRAHFVEYVPESTWCPEYFCSTTVPRDGEFLDKHYAYLREFWYRVCMRRDGADALCFTTLSSSPQPKKKRKKAQLLVTM